MVLLLERKVTVKTILLIPSRVVKAVLEPLNAQCAQGWRSLDATTQRMVPENHLHIPAHLESERGTCMQREK